MHAHFGRLISLAKQNELIKRDIALILASYNIGAEAEKVYIRGAIVFVDNANMLAKRFKHDKLFIVGL